MKNALMPRRAATRLALLGAGLAAAIATPYATSSYNVSLITLVLIFGMLAASVNLMAGHMGLVSVGHAGIAAAAGYGLAWASKNGHGIGAQLLFAVVLTLLVSAVYGLVSMRTHGIFFLMVTLALGMVVYGLAYRMAPVTGGENGLSGIRRPAFLSEYWQFYFFTLALFVLVTLALWVVARSPFGSVMRGIRESESRMSSLGYALPAYKFTAMMISGSVAGLAGVMAVWHAEFVSPSSAGFLRSALAVVMVILGGTGTVFGPLVGSSIVVWTEHVLSTHLERWPTVLGLIFIVVILFAPSGILGGGSAAVARWRARRATGRPQPAPGAEPGAPPGGPARPPADASTPTASSTTASSTTASSTTAKGQ